MSDGGRNQQQPSQRKLQWDWDVEHRDRAREAKADKAIHHAQPFLVDRRVLKDVVKEKFQIDVARIAFLSSGTFHKAYIVTLVDGFELVARVARRFMPRIKTESEVATMDFLRKHTNCPVPKVFHYDANPYNRLGGEYILMSKAKGIPLSKVYHSMSHNNLVKLLDNAATLLISLFGLRFPQLGSLYKGQRYDSSVPTPRPPSAYTPHELASIHTPPTPSSLMTPRPQKEFHVGQIVSWPFFGSNRGQLQHPEEINRGPWSSSHDYLLSCAQREINGVILENAGKSAPHRLHLDPDEIRSSWHHHLRAVPGDQSDDSDEYDLEESEDEWEGGPGDSMYRDYRRMQRSTFLIAHLRERENRVREEMSRFLKIMERLGVKKLDDASTVAETFGLDCHDLNLENVFVDEKDNTRITCVIDWESTTTRPLWACAHVPAFLNNSPFTVRLYRQAVAKLASKAPATPPSRQQRGYFPSFSQGTFGDAASLAKEWLFYEESGARLRMAHRCIEWDGWEEGLVESILGPEDEEDDWFKEWVESALDSPAVANPEMYGLDSVASKITLNDGHNGYVQESTTNSRVDGNCDESDGKCEVTRNQVSAPLKVPDGKLGPHGIGRKKGLATKVVEEEKAKEKQLGPGGDICGGIGGELGRRLEAWLHQDQHSAPVAWVGIETPTALSRTVSFGE